MVTFRLWRVRTRTLLYQAAMHATDLPVMALSFLFQFIRALSSSLGSQATQEGHRDHRAPFTSSRCCTGGRPRPRFTWFDRAFVAGSQVGQIRESRSGPE